MRVCLLLPTKNEGEGLGPFLDRLRPHVDEIIVIDGHSTDDTVAICRGKNVPVLVDNGRGKGAAIRQGLERATGDIVVIMDADGSHDPGDIPLLTEPIIRNEADLVVGSRILGGSDELHGDFTQFLRNVGGDILTMAINYRWHVRLTDVLNGFRAIRREAVPRLRLRADDFDIEQHMVVEALKRGLRVKDVAAHESVRQWGVSKLPTFRKATLFFWRLFLDLITP